MSGGWIVIDECIIGHISRGGAMTPSTRRAKRFWCFKCRKRHLHRGFILDPGPYYDPEWLCKCDGCDGDHRRFGE
jgi:hypothetical protein